MFKVKGDGKVPSGYSKRGFKVYVFLILLASISGGINTLLGGAPHFLTAFWDLSLFVNVMLDMMIIFFIYGLIGLFGFKLAGEVGLPGMWRAKYPALEDYIKPIILGLLAAGGFLLIEIIFASLHGLGNFPLPEAPFSFFTLVISAVGEEVLFRLFLIPLIINFMLKLWRKLGGVGFNRRKKLRRKFFWPAAIMAGIFYTLIHSYDIIYSLEIVEAAQIPLILWLQIIVMHLLLSLLSAWQYRKKGFLAAVVFHGFFGLGWYVIWGNIIL